MVGLGMIGLYVLSHLEARHIAGPLCLVLFLVLALVRIKPGHAKIIVLILCAACAAAVGPRLADVAVTGLKNHGVIRNSHWKVAEEFARIGIPPGIPVASIGNAAFNDWAFLAQARVVAEIPSDMYWLYFMRPMHAVEQFWSSSKQEKDLVLDLMRQAGARVAVSNEVSENADVSGWTRIPDSEFWYRVLDPAL
jgi:hypothetical protein